MKYLEATVRLIILRCDAYLKRQGIERSLGDFPALLALSYGYKDDTFEDWAGQEEAYRDKSFKFTDVCAKRYFRYLSMLKADDITRTLVDLSLASFYYPEFDDYLKGFFKMPVCLRLAFLLEEVPFPDEADILEKAQALSVFYDIDPLGSPLMDQRFKTDDRTVGYLSGSDVFGQQAAQFGTIFDPKAGLNPLYVNEDLVRRGTDFFKRGGMTLQLSGRGGRRFIAKHIAANLGRKFVLTDLKELSLAMGKGFYLVRNALVREAVFQDAGVVIYGITDRLLEGGDRHTIEILEKNILAHFLDFDIPLILCCDIPVFLTGEYSQKKYLMLELDEKPGYDERLKIWKGFKESYGLERINPEDAAMRYHLTASETMKVVRRIADEPEESDRAGLARLSKLALSASGATGTLKLGKILFPDIRLSDVKLKPERRELLENIIGSVRVSNEVLSEWKLGKKYSYGNGVSVLLSGPPGTGKTMSANAIAAELGIPLYQIKLSNVVDKYIGETEKNLERIFSFAEKANVVLFFDEADSLFGKRSDVKDSKDKYANNEISYLLQRIEAYSGIVILSTNIKGNIDPAFMRRIRYVVHFDIPDEDVRRQIWESVLTDDVPHEKLDIDYLVTQFSTFTGSIIKTVFLNACCDAACSGEKLSMKHIVYAISLELAKESTVSFSVDALGRYSGYARRF